MKSMKFLLAGAVLATTAGLSVPASAQRFEIGPDGPGIDLRSRGQRMRDREEAREDRYYREQRFRDGDRRGFRRDSRRDYDY